ncbi:2-succinylbenzoate--CoA ligase [Calothrix sp. UHCC 0171]|uniref:2-succinylbenzoate--CoA ligase n=1 Tax=Calothrix sp. UHCC 0171 TaxID=3110245 RepID=UPI002B1F9C92|nr:2-succinylbenzoate--CoA ligase [Calothrix sp. UHCC 0171]MEA5570874.1 2-succinylbenzoate--CoA ligase [Calothrix sp. UHCC 0171]
MNRELFKYFENLADDWLFGSEKYQFQQLIGNYYLEINKVNKADSIKELNIIICDRNPVNFLAAFLAACTTNSQVFLCNPDWGENEWQYVLDLAEPDIILGQGAKYYLEHGLEYDLERRRQGDTKTCKNSESATHQHPFIMIPTGGSSGEIKFAIHTWETLMASVRGFTEYFQIKEVNSVCVLPLYHVSGLMQFMRAFTTGGKLVILPFKYLESGKILNIQNIHYTDFFISLVPTQLQRLLDNSSDKIDKNINAEININKYLAEFKAVLLGGAATWNELLEKAKFHKIKLAPTYGMTETASQVVTLKPDHFLNGKLGCGQVLPHAEVIICDEEDNILPANNIGKIQIKSTSLALGYYSINYQNIKNNLNNNINNFSREYFFTDDVGYLDQDGYLHLIGRNSEKIISGGENIYPKEIEAAIRATDMVIDICVIGLQDKYWGQVVTAIYIPKYANTSILAIQTILKYKLSKFKIPKHWIPVTELPRNHQGKVNRQKLYEIAIPLLQL